MNIIYSICSPKEVNRQNLINDGGHSGEGVFGVCSKKLYRGNQCRGKAVQRECFPFPYQTRGIYSRKNGPSR